MPTRFWLVVAALALAGCQRSKSEPETGPGGAEKSPGRVIVVKASYPGAGAVVTSDTVAAPVEQQLLGTEGLTRIESESRNDGTYLARLYFEDRTDPRVAQILVQNRIHLIETALPPVVSRSGIIVESEDPVEDPHTVSLAVIDRSGAGWAELQSATTAIQKRLASETAVLDPRIVAPDEEQLRIHVDREKCAQLGVTVHEVYQALGAASHKKPDELEKVKVREVPLSAVVAAEPFVGPTLVARVNGYRAVRIVGKALPGESSSAGPKCIALARDELKKFRAGMFAVETTFGH